MIRKTILFFVFIFFISLNANSKSYRIGDKIRGNLEFYKKYVFDLPDGEWVVADKYAYSYYGVVSKGYILLKIKNKKAIEWINIGELDIGSRYQSIFNSILQEIVFKNKYDGCYDRPEYYVLEYFAKGSSHNCFKPRPGLNPGRPRRVWVVWLARPRARCVCEWPRQLRELARAVDPRPLAPRLASDAPLGRARDQVARERDEDGDPGDSFSHPNVIRSQSTAEDGLGTMVEEGSPSDASDSPSRQSIKMSDNV